MAAADPEAVNNTQGTMFDPTALGDDNRYTGASPIQCDAAVLGDQGNCLVAVVLDNQVVSAPQIPGC